jgi:membrane-associated phospholipid phosphatase
VRLLKRSVGALPWWAAAVAAVVLLFITLDILHQGALASLDHAVSNQMRRWDLGHRPVKPAIYVLTLFGLRGSVLSVTVPLMVYMSWRSRTLEPMLRYIAALVILTIAVYALKYATGRTAPIHDMVHSRSGQSFPSGHIANSIIIWNLVWWTAGRSEMPAWFVRTLGTVRYAGPAAVVVGMTLLDYHWVSDFAGGACVAVIVLWVVLLPAWEQLARPLDQLSQRPRAPSAGGANN